jgi:hypothetical protein
VAKRSGDTALARSRLVLVVATDLVFCAFLRSPKILRFSFPTREEEENVMRET